MKRTHVLLALIAVAALSTGAIGPEARPEGPCPSLATALQEGMTTEQAEALRANNVHTGIPRAELASERCGDR